MSVYYQKLRLPDGSMKDEQRYVMEQHLGRLLSPDEVVHHINGQIQDNRLCNLQVMTRREHAQYHLKGRPGRKLTPEEREAVRWRLSGEGSWFHKLTVEQVKEIRNRASQGESCAQLAQIFRVHRSTIRRACNGEHWACVPISELRIPVAEVERFEWFGPRITI